MKMFSPRDARRKHGLCGGKMAVCPLHAGIKTANTSSGYRYLVDGDTNRRKSLHIGRSASKTVFSPLGGDIFRGH